jgi:hypothetical protein
MNMKRVLVLIALLIAVALPILFGTSTSSQVTSNSAFRFRKLAAEPTGIAGDVFYNTATNRFEGKNNSAWANFATTAGASIPTIAQGDLLYGSGVNTLSALAKSGVAGSFLRNSGSANNPAWGILSSGDITTGLGFTPENSANKSVDGTFAGNSDTLYPSQKAAKTYVDAAVAGISVPVTSVFGRTGAVVAASNDYSFAQLSGKPTTFSGYSISDTSANLRAALTDENGSGVALFDNATSPTFITPALGTPSVLTLTNATGLPVAGLSNLGSNVGTFLITPSSANFAAAVTGETGTGNVVFSADPVFSGAPSLPTATTATTQSAGDSSTKLATTAFVTTADNLKANLASPTFTGTVALPTGVTVNGNAQTFPTTAATLARTDAANSFTGTQTFLGVLRGADGSSGTPEFAFTSETNTGFYRQGFGTIGVNLVDSNASILFNYSAGGAGGRGITLGSPAALTWTNAANATSTIDTDIFRSAAGVVGVGTTGTTANGKITALDFLVGAATAPSANNTAVIGFADNVSKPTLAGTLPTALYNKGGEQYVQDSSANETLISPHDPITGEWVFRSTNDRTNHSLYIRTERLLKVLAERCGEPCKGLIEESGLTTVPAILNPTPADMGGAKGVLPTPGATVTVTIDPTVKHTIAVWTSGEAETINISGTPQDGSILTMIISNDAVLARILTPNTGLSGLGIATGIASKKSTISYVAYGGTFYETSRTIAF